MSSPRAWGCFVFQTQPPCSPLVFPTCVGVFLHACRFRSGRVRLPHVRGGVSQLYAIGMMRLLSSPRAWGCFYGRPEDCFGLIVFPTCVGVFLFLASVAGFVPSLPHVRGGVSVLACSIAAPSRSSPRAWGCFLSTPACCTPRDVFPTCVGVFLSPSGFRNSGRGLPHVRGGVSRVNTAGQASERSSPRAWGCFCTGAHPYAAGAVFPTCVGVFLFKGEVAH